jgi:ubiquinone biosynthesis protein
VRRVLAATDRSETATRAVAWAAEMAARYEAELLLLQVLVEDGTRHAAERELAAYADQLAVPRVQTLVTVDDDPARAIVEAAKEQQADVIVVGSVGMQGRKEFLLGNVPNRVSHNAPCTVVIVQTT